MGIKSRGAQDMLYFFWPVNHDDREINRVDKYLTIIMTKFEQLINFLFSIYLPFFIFLP